MSDYSKSFIKDMVDYSVIKFGKFVLKSGRSSPYFFNLGSINRGPGLERLGKAYAKRIQELAVDFDLIFGPAYKGIPIAITAAVSLANLNLNVGVTFNRKEAKAHGEQGRLIGEEMKDQRVLIADDVITAGTAIYEATNIITQAGGKLVGVVVALDRQEFGEDGVTALDKLTNTLKVPTVSIATLSDVIAYLDEEDPDENNQTLLKNYQRQYCRIS